ncbi:WHG domain-containing protein [Micromonospora sp. M12]
MGTSSAGHLRLIELSYAMLRGYGLDEPALTDAMRFVRSTFHGFASLETVDGFGHPRCRRVVALDPRRGAHHVEQLAHRAEQRVHDTGAAVNSHDHSVQSTDGTRLLVRRLGVGDPVVLVHGSGGGLHSWAAVAEHLAPSTRCGCRPDAGTAPATSRPASSPSGTRPPI